MHSALWIKGQDLMLRVYAQPAAKKTEWAGLYGSAYKLRVCAPPIEGKANDAVCRFVADFFGWPQRQVGLSSGATNRHKTLCFHGAAREFDAFSMQLSALPID